MASVLSHIPGLNAPLTSTDLFDSRGVFNALTDIEDLEIEISDLHLQNLAELFVAYDAHTKLGIHLLHNHTKLEDGHIMLGEALPENIRGIWNKPMAMTDVDLSKVHGHIFKLVDQEHFVAYEFGVGDMTDLSGINPSFFSELAQYFLKNNLQHEIGLENLCGQNIKDMIELDFTNWGIVMLQTTDVRHDSILRTTGWRFQSLNGIIDFKGNTIYLETEWNGKPHKVFVDGKLNFRKGDIIAVLRHFDVID